MDTNLGLEQRIYLATINYGMSSLTVDLLTRDGETAVQRQGRLAQTLPFLDQVRVPKVHEGLSMEDRLVVEGYTQMKIHNTVGRTTHTPI